MQDFEELLALRESLNQHLAVYQKNYPSVTISAIAKRIGKSEGCLRSLLNRHHTSSPRPDTILNLMGVLLQKRNFGDVIENSFEPIKAFLIRSFPLYIGSEKRVILGSSQVKIDDREEFLIVWLCGTTEGYSRENILLTLGTTVTSKLDDLLNQGCLRLCEDGNIRTIEENLFIPPTLMKKYIGELFRLWDINNIKGNNIMYALGEDVSQEFVRESIKKLSKTYAEIREDSKKEKNLGKKKFIACVYGQALSLALVLMLTFSFNVFARSGIEGGGGGLNLKSFSSSDR